MNELFSVGILVGVIILLVVVTKAVWQWVLGTDVLILEAKNQTALLKKIYEEIKSKEAKNSE